MTVVSADLLKGQKKMQKIRMLPDTLVNQIAAGEVVERPASVVKELVENSIDAGATDIRIMIRDGGRSSITIVDNGWGIGPEDLVLAADRHATSKIPDEDLFNISTLGFRGEALPSIASISRMTITSRKEGDEQAWSLSIEGGRKSEIVPASHPAGTRIDVRDLFYATPARLKFLKSASAETSAIVEVIERLAMAHPVINFTLTQEQKNLCKFSHNPSTETEKILLQRLEQVIGRDFTDNSVAVDGFEEGLRLSGYIGLPTLNRGNASLQYLFVNGRHVRDKLLQVAVRLAYQDFLARDRHPVLALFLEVDPAEVDVNVHPAKSEVRFRNQEGVRKLVMGSLKQALATAGHRASTTIAMEAINRSSAFAAPKNQTAITPPLSRGMSELPRLSRHPGMSVPKQGRFSDYGSLYPGAEEKRTPVETVRESTDSLASATTYDVHYAQPDSTSSHYEAEAPGPMDIPPLGYARAQLHETYIIAETSEGIVIVDQHAVHERLVYEKLKSQLAHSGIQRQLLLVPEVVELDTEACVRILAAVEELETFGLVIESFGGNAVLVREVPALVRNMNIRQTIQDLSDEIAEYGHAVSLKRHIDEICSTIACHGSIRSGRKLSIEEMNALLRQMEATPYSGQCNHGRPTYVELKRKDIETLFGRR